MTATPLELTLIRSKAFVDRRTLARFLASEDVRPLCAVRIFDAIRDLGFGHLLPGDRSAAESASTTITTIPTPTKARTSNVPCKRSRNSAAAKSETHRP